MIVLLQHRHKQRWCI